MKAWLRAAGKLARYEHIGWNEWPQSRCCAFHSGAMGNRGMSAGMPRSSCSTGAAILAVDGRARTCAADADLGTLGTGPESTARRPARIVLSGRCHERFPYDSEPSEER